MGLLIGYINVLYATASVLSLKVDNSHASVGSGATGVKSLYSFVLVLVMAALMGIAPLQPTTPLSHSSSDHRHDFKFRVRAIQRNSGSQCLSDQTRINSRKWDRNPRASSVVLALLVKQE